MSIERVEMLVDSVLLLLLLLYQLSLNGRILSKASSIGDNIELCIMLLLRCSDKWPDLA
jgi:hypothetical protein